MPASVMPQSSREKFAQLTRINTETIGYMSSVLIRVLPWLTNFRVSPWQAF